MLSKSQIQQIQLLKTVEHKTDTEIARILGVNRRSVVKYANDKNYTENAQNAQFIKKYTEVKENEAKGILELVSGVKYEQIAIDIVDLLDKDSLEKEKNVRGIRGLTALLGNTIDKTVALRKLVLEERKVDIAERTLALKEEELQARLDNPEAFTNIMIVNDTDEAAIKYKEESKEHYVSD